MTSIPQVATAMQDVLTTIATQAGVESGFVQRPPSAKLDGAALAQCFALTMLATPTPSLEELCQTAAAIGVTISPQGLDQRLTPTAARCLQQVLQAALQRVIAVQPVALPLLQRFPGGVAIHDSSTIVLPPDLAALWTGCGGSTAHGDAALKLQLRLDVLHGQLRGELQHGRDADRASRLAQDLPAATLYVADLGYWSVGQLDALSQQGVHWLSRMQPSTAVQTATGQWWMLADLFAAHDQQAVLDLPVKLGKTQPLAARLIAVRVPQEVADQRRRRLRETAQRKGRTVSAASLALAGWTILVTNLPAEQLSVTEALVLARLRWQIELLFKLWKSHGQVDLLRAVQRWRLVCELYGRLLAMVVQHWVLLSSCWAYPDRSLPKAAQTVRKHALGLAKALRCSTRLAQELTDVARCIGAGCRINRRKTHPNAFQLVQDPDLLTIA